MRIRMVFAAVLTALTMSSCYHIGSIMHPQIKTIAVGSVVNDTASFNAAAQVRGALCERFMFDGSLRLVDMDEADCIIYARVTRVAFSEVSSISRDNNDDIFIPREWRASVSVEYSVVMPGRREPLLKGSVNGVANFQVQADMTTNQLQGVRQAAYDAAGKIVNNVTEGW